nr:hypothetical protein [uncultured Porphyromonas sp.]
MIQTAHISSLNLLILGKFVPLPRSRSVEVRTRWQVAPLMP